jgi:valyl-tRNA synthetase
VARMETLIELVREVRNTRTAYNVDPGRRIQVLALPGGYRTELDAYGYVFARLCNVDRLDLIADAEATPANCAAIVVNDVTFFLPLQSMFDSQAECARLQKEADRLTGLVTGLEQKLRNEGFTSNAPAPVVERERARLADLQASLAQVGERMAAICGE